MLFSIQGDLWPCGGGGSDTLSCCLGAGVNISEGLGCIVGMSFSKSNGCSVPSSPGFTEGEAEERGMLF